MPLGSAGSRGHLPDLVPGSILWVADGGRALLEKLADAGKPTELGGGEAIVGKTLERAGLVLFTRNSASAVITPKGAPRDHRSQVCFEASFAQDAAVRLPELVEIFVDTNLRLPILLADE
jgi:hypothetical protein